MTTTRRRGAALEGAILDAGWDQLAAEGYARFTFEAVADRAKTGKAVLYRRWPDKEALLLAVIAHRYLGPPREVPDTGSLRGDVLALLRSADRLGENIAALFSTILGAYFEETKTPPAQLRARLLGERALAMPRIVDQAVRRGELTTDLPPRVVSLPVDLLRHEAVMHLGRVPDETLVDIVDTVFLPLVREYGRREVG